MTSTFLFAGMLAGIVANASAGSAGASAFILAPMEPDYQISTADLRLVDFSNLTYRLRGVAPDLSIPLVAGTYHAQYGVGFESAELLDRAICGGPSVVSPFAIVRLRYLSGAGSSTCAEIIQLFRIHGGRLVARHEIVYACAPDGVYDVDCARKTVTATAATWQDGAPDCCPSARDTGTFSVVGDRLSILSLDRASESARAKNPAPKNR